MSAWSTLAVLALLLLLLAVVTAAQRPSSPGSTRRHDAAVVRAKIAELEKLGVTRDDVVRYIWRLRQADPDRGRAAWPPRTAADRRLVADGNLLVRHFVRNRTASCNDGSSAGCVCRIGPVSK